MLTASFLLEPDPDGAERARADRYLEHRRRTQPVDKSAGSIFKNPPDAFAGRLIEAAGATCPARQSRRSSARCGTSGAGTRRRARGSIGNRCRSYCRRPRRPNEGRKGFGPINHTRPPTGAADE